MLGLVPDPDVLVDGRKLAAARKRSQMDLRQLVSRINARGWEVTMQEALKWELGRPALAPALITAIAEELSVGDDALLTAVRPTGGVDDLFDDQTIQAFLSDWAAEAGV
jgi:transcriptional regulator with XRE-family HTH domain